MKRIVAIVVICVLAILGVIALRERASRSSATDDSAAHPVRGTRPRPDPAQLVRGSIAGTVADEEGRPVAGAHVCAEGRSQDLSAELFRDAPCVTSDAHGGYAIDRLLPATYAVSAWARTYKPGLHERVVLHAGGRDTAIEIVLATGGVEITGGVVDVTGGTIAHARVSATAQHDLHATAATATTEADDHGGFSLWVAPGSNDVTTTAEGYTDAHTWVDAPATIEVRMTPEATLAGIVVDAATGEPIDGARVELEQTNDWSGRDQATLSDATGAFRFTRIVPGRFASVARTDRGYGRSEGTSLVGLGQHVEGVVVRMFPAHAVEGRVVIGKAKTPCEDAYVLLTDPGDDQRWAVLANTDGLLRAEGVLPGTYTPKVWCHHAPSPDAYPPVIVADRDVTGLEWPVAIGGSVRGRVLTATGTPVEGVRLTLGPQYRDPTGFQRSGPGGAYAFTGFAAGDYELSVSSSKVKVAVTIVETTVVERDLEVEASGTIEGTVVDGDGKPIARQMVMAVSTGEEPVYGSGTSDQRGVFIMRAVAPGEYYLAGSHDAFDRTKPHATVVVVRADQVSTSRLVIAAAQGFIKGTVVDEHARPISDAYVGGVAESTSYEAPEASARYAQDEPVVTATDGTFSLPVLGAGTYMLHAQRRGGGEVFVGHVAVGSTITLQIHATGSIAGTVRGADGMPPEHLTIEVSDTTMFQRREQLFQTQGRYAMRDLPSGKYTLRVEAAGGWKQREVELAEGETKTVDLELEALVTVTGRLVDLKTHQPVASIAMSASSATPSPAFVPYKATTDAAGRFTFLRTPLGPLTISASSDGETGYHEAETTRAVTGPGDLGDVTILRSRSAGSDPVGVLGFDCASRAPYLVHSIDPDGPAAKSGLAVGDAITSVDGIDVTGTGHASYTAIVTAPPGTPLAFGLARNTTVTITLAAPPPD